MICVPPDKDGKISPAVLVAANEVDIDRIAKIGGAQAIAAMAYGTESIPRQNLIVGPGNIYVTIAKKMVYGQVGLDMLAGPSEVVILADDTAQKDIVATDLLAQAEHSPDAKAYLVVTDSNLAMEVIAEVGKYLKQISKKSLEINIDIWPVQIIFYQRQKHQYLILQ